MLDPVISIYIPKAMDAIDNFMLDSNRAGKVKKETKGYVASFGPSVIQSGLLPTVAFYSEQGEANANRSSVLDAIAHILNWDLSELAGNRKRFLRYIQAHEPQDIEEDVLNALVALKLSLRTYDFGTSEPTQS